MMPFLDAAGWDQTVTLANKHESLQTRNRVALRAAIARILTIGGVLASSTATDYKDWTVADERSLDEVTGFCKFKK